MILGAFSDLWARVNAHNRDFGIALRRLRLLPRADWGRVAAHAGLGVTLLGIATITAWEIEDIRVAHPGDTYEVGAYELRFEGVSQREGPNYRAAQAEFKLTKRGTEIAILKPERRVYTIARMQTTEAAIDIGFFRDVYVVIGELQPSGGWTTKTYIKPLANWIWGGALLMAFGGLLSLSDRRLRVASVLGRRHRRPEHAG